ncbi:hypothetical protein L0P50_18875, partial [Lawsonibacter sp. DFI.6.74]|nr:hypothetical protein [Lawsonibacter sp. DFI.6.74]
LKEFKLTTNSNVAVILSGLSQVNAPKIIKYILKNNNHVEVFVDTRRTILDEVIDKIKELKALIDEKGLDVDIQVDGGIKPSNVS